MDENAPTFDGTPAFSCDLLPLPNFQFYIKVFTNFLKGYSR